MNLSRGNDQEFCLSSLRIMNAEAYEQRQTTTFASIEDRVGALNPLTVTEAQKILNTATENTYLLVPGKINVLGQDKNDLRLSLTDDAGNSIEVLSHGTYLTEKEFAKERQHILRVGSNSELPVLVCSPK